MLFIDPETLINILQGLTGLSLEVKVAIGVSALGLVLTAWRIGWGHGRNSGRNYEVLHGRVPKLQDKLSELRHENAVLQSRLDVRNFHIEEMKRSRGLTSPDEEKPKLAPELEELRQIRELTRKDDVEIWRLRKPAPSIDLKARLLASACKIVTIGNLKGGVGKTTLTANLAAFFDIALGKRVFVIDLDYQGSLSAMMLQAAKKTIDASLAEFLLSGQDGQWLVAAARDIRPVLDRTHLIPAGYSLQQMEDQLLAQWLFHTIGKDPRFNLAEALLSPSVQDRYDIILIDIGPRLTVASLSAIIASSHIVVPSNLDNLSAEMIAGFVKQTVDIRHDLGLPAALAGIVGTFTFRQQLTRNERDVIRRINEELVDLRLEPYIFNTNMPRKQSIANVAGRQIAYLEKDDVKVLIDNLGREIAERISI